MYRDPHFEIEMYELWAPSIHRLMLRALEKGQEDRARELYLKFRKTYDSLKGWRINEVKSGVLKSLREFKQGLSSRERKLLSKLERTMRGISFERKTL